MGEVNRLTFTTYHSFRSALFLSWGQKKMLKKKKKMNVLSCQLILGLICKCQLKASCMGAASELRLQTFVSLPSWLLGRFSSHPVIWHNADNTLFTLEVFPPTVGSDPGDMKPLLEKNPLAIALYVPLWWTVVEYIILKRPKKLSCSQ